MDLIGNNIQKIASLCQRYNVSKLFVFGSILTSRFNEESDVDLLVTFNKSEVKDYFDNYFDFKYSLYQQLLNFIGTIQNPYLKMNVDATKTLIYG